ncbi:SDR family NAD(P)-dependent oxidoreductase [Sedimenticola sp.]|uniref:SDR family NAD(P)-dependent oxidoreductase n=1 Tax=Sedimenticola sp. TaxID=1940285 RepID=UPI003D0D8996
MTTRDTSWLELNDCVAAVTGAGGGIGHATAIALASAGAHVAVLERDGSRAEAVAKELVDAGHSAIGLQCDVRDAQSVKQAAQSVAEQWGRCDVLVNNAGILKPGALSELDIKDWDEMLQVNLRGYLLCSQEFGHMLRAQECSAIVHVSSISASNPQPFSGAYSPGKAAVSMLSRQLAFEWGPEGVRSNVVSPGLVRTPLSEAFYQDAEVKRKREAIVPVRRIGTPEDMANAALFLASPRAGYINGQEIVVDGGLSQTLMSHVPRPGYE